MQSEAIRTPQQRWTLLAVCTATFMLLVDITILNVALPSIGREFGTPLSGLQWVVDGYAMPLAALLLLTGVLADRFGRRTVFAAGTVTFTLASAACGAAGSPLMLDLARAVQGVGGAAMFATALALIAQEFAGMQRVAALAVWGSTVGGAVAVGPLLGGVLTQALDWRWIFFVNVPVGAFTVAVAALRMRESRGESTGRLDVAGPAAFSVALFLLVHGLLRGNASGWSSPLILGSLAGGAALMVAFAAVESRSSRPVLDLALFAQPAFLGVSIATFAIGAGMFAMFLYLSIYLQGVLRYDPLATGMRLLPITVMVFAVPLVTRRVAQRIAPTAILGPGLLLVAAGLALMRIAGAGSAWTALLPGFVVAGIGIGLSNPAIAAAAVGVVGRERSGMASGISNTFRLGGLATGVAALGAIFEHRIAVGLGPAARLAPAVAAGATHSLRGHAAVVADRSIVAGLHEILLVGSLIVLAGAVASLATAGLLGVRATPLPAPSAQSNT